MSEAGVHRPHVGGIHGRSNDGAYSLVLAGGFADEVVSHDTILFFRTCLDHLVKYRSFVFQKDRYIKSYLFSIIFMLK